MNPHVRFYVDVKDASGVVTNWDLELMSPNTLKRAGWDSHALKVGDEVSVTAYMAKDGTKRGNARGSLRSPMDARFSQAMPGTATPNRRRIPMSSRVVHLFIAVLVMLAGLQSPTSAAAQGSRTRPRTSARSASAARASSTQRTSRSFRRLEWRRRNRRQKSQAGR